MEISVLLIIFFSSIVLLCFFAGIEKYTPNLVSWNGGGFDLPVLHYRALLHGVNASRYWEIGNHGV